MKYDTFKDMTSIKFNKAAEMNFDCCSIASLDNLQNSSSGLDRNECCYPIFIKLWYWKILYE